MGRKRRGEGHTRRDEILRAAKHLFLSEGFESTTIRKIADRVGVSAPALYLYFDDKDAILLALCDQTFGFLIGKMAELQSEELSPRERLRRCGEAYIRFGLEHPQEYWLTFMSGNTPKQIEGPRRRLAPEGELPHPASSGAIAFQHLVCVLRQIEAAGVRLNYPADTSAELLWMSLHGLVAALINSTEIALSRRESLIEGMLGIAERGVLAD